MYIECITIVVLIGLCLYVVFRSGRHAQALAFLPLLCVPGFYLLSAPLYGVLRRFFGFSRASVISACTVAGLVVACLLFGMLCGNFESRRTRRGYLWLCGGFSALLALILIFHAPTIPIP